VKGENGMDMFFLPRGIKIGGHWLRIELRNRQADAYDKGGSTNSFSGVIILNADLSPSKKWSCLLHEVLHELNWQLDLELDERQISGVAEGLFQVLTDNGLWSWQEKGGDGDEGN